jgi:hypothetical protein
LQTTAPGAVGVVYFCSNCNPAGKILVSTGMAAGNFADAAGGPFQ